MKRLFTSLIHQRRLRKQGIPFEHKLPRRFRLLEDRYNAIVHETMGLRNLLEDPRAVLLRNLEALSSRLLEKLDRTEKFAVGEIHGFLPLEGSEDDIARAVVLNLKHARGSDAVDVSSVDGGEELKELIDSHQEGLFTISEQIFGRHNVIPDGRLQKTLAVFKVALAASVLVAASMAGVSPAVSVGLYAFILFSATIPQTIRTEMILYGYQNEIEYRIRYGIDGPDLEFEASVFRYRRGLYVESQSLARLSDYTYVLAAKLRNLEKQ